MNAGYQYKTVGDPTLDKTFFAETAAFADNLKHLLRDAGYHDSAPQPACYLLEIRLGFYLTRAVMASQFC
jgi:hypothetical protein